MITIPSADEIEEYGRRLEPAAPGIPRISDAEAVCHVRVLNSGSGAYWSQGDVDTHILYAKQNGLVPGLVGNLMDGLPHQASLAQALREQRDRRRRLQLGGVETTATGLVVLHAPSQLFVPARLSRASD